eukprot:1798724-Pyramimonas_sp.AAC.1
MMIILKKPLERLARRYVHVSSMSRGRRQITVQSHKACGGGDGRWATGGEPMIVGNLSENAHDLPVASPIVLRMSCRR